MTTSRPCPTKKVIGQSPNVHHVVERLPGTSGVECVFYWKILTCAVTPNMEAHHTIIAPNSDI